MDWSRLSASFDAVLDAAPEHRDAIVDKVSGKDPELGQQLREMLAGLEPGEAFPDPYGKRGIRAETTTPDADSLRLKIGSRVGAWAVTGHIGQGGMGDVYAVERIDGGFEQDAALKILGPLDEDGVALFHHERQTVARLEHPGIARLLDGGVDADGRPWMVVERVDGLPLDGWCRERDCSAEDRVRLVLEVCDCLDYAHSRLLVHRDIKPSNILVDENGRTRLIDFGISAGAGDAGEARASLRYAAPEVLLGDAAGTSGDVYAMAATLHELLAGHPPADTGASALSVMAWVSQGAPVTRLCDESGTVVMPGALRADLDAILMRALAARPEDRYRSVQAFADDLRRALAREPVSTRAASAVYRFHRFFERHAVASLSVAGLIVVLAAGLGISAWQQAQIRAERDSVVREQTRLAAVQDYLFFMLRDAAEREGEVGIRDVLDSAATRVTERLAEDPETGGRVLHALSELYFHVNDYEAAEPLLRRLVAMDVLSPELRATAAYDLAQVSQRRGEPDLARTQLDAAQAFWATNPVRYRREQVDSRLVEARLLRDEGQIEDAIALLRQVLPEQIALNGADFRETGVFHNDLGVMLLMAGQLEPAAQELARARDIWRINDLDTGPDALNTLNNLAAAEFLLGRPDRAAPVFREATELREALYGPSAALAAALGNYGKSLIATGDYALAAGVLGRSRQMALEFAGSGSLHFAASSAGLLEALIADGRSGEAWTVMLDDDERLASATEPGSPAQGAFDVGAARVFADSGDLAAAAERLDRAEAAFATLGPAGGRYIATINTLRVQYGLADPDLSVPGEARRGP
ncbi:protein kinase [Maricaulis sp.]|uniref:protein kinase domain-containing protein n=1 Tax=Maricaulis sp. TaxID=1486257 RepID=UPI00329863E1